MIFIDLFLWLFGTLLTEIPTAVPMDTTKKFLHEERV